MLIDLIEYQKLMPRPPGAQGDFRVEWYLAAIVVRKDQPAVHIDLGPSGPIAEAVTAWRLAIGQRAGGIRRGVVRLPENESPKKAEPRPQAKLHQKLLAPLLPHLHDARVLLISPDGLAARIPWPALPGSSPDRYLIEEVSVVIVPAARELIGNESARSGGQPPVEIDSLLVVGDVDFGEQPPVDTTSAQENATVPAVRQRFARLPGTAAELDSIVELFGKSFRKAPMTALRGVEASESAVRRYIVKHRYVHLATHGFFAPPKVQAAVSAARALERQGVSPFKVDRVPLGLLSGAGANLSHGAADDDGLLTAEEVTRLDLTEVDLVTLSACETALGRVAGGEGVLGLQRAFQLAGARTTVTTLWKVDDQATQLLITRFYENLWQKKMSKRESLREAQLWMLQEAGKPNADGSRGLAAFDKPQRPTDSSHLPPFYWAAFVLSGDWR